MSTPNWIRIGLIVAAAVSLALTSILLVKLGALPGGVRFSITLGAANLVASTVIGIVCGLAIVRTGRSLASGFVRLCLVSFALLASFLGFLWLHSICVELATGVVGVRIPSTPTEADFDRAARAITNLFVTSSTTAVLVFLSTATRAAKRDFVSFFVLLMLALAGLTALLLALQKI